MNRKDWLKLLGGLAVGITGAGMFGAGPLAALFGEGAAAGAGAGGAAGALGGGPGGLSSSGMFSGPSFLSQGAPFAPGMESLGAKDAVNLAREAGHLGLGDFMKERGAVELMNMNQPGEWMARLGRNADRFAGNAARGAATSAMTGMFAPPTPQPGAMPMPRPPTQAQPGGVDNSNVQKLVAAAQAGDPIAQQQLAALMKRLNFSGV